MMQKPRPKEVREWLEKCSPSQREEFFVHEMEGCFSPSLEWIKNMNAAIANSKSSQSNGNYPFNQLGWSEQSQQRKII